MKLSKILEIMDNYHKLSEISPVDDKVVRDVIAEYENIQLNNHMEAKLRKMMEFLPGIRSVIDIALTSVEYMHYQDIENKKFNDLGSHQLVIFAFKELVDRLKKWEEE